MPWLLYFILEPINNIITESKKNIIIFISFKINPITFPSPLSAFLSFPFFPFQRENFLQGVWVCSRFNFDFKSNTIHNQQLRRPASPRYAAWSFLKWIQNVFKRERKGFKFNFVYGQIFYAVSYMKEDVRYLNCRSHHDNPKTLKFNYIYLHTHSKTFRMKGSFK